jgi:threonine aldolase
VNTLADVEAAVSRHWKQPGMLLLELPQREIGGQCITWTDLVKISEMCKKRNIALHCDGARLWEAQTFYNRPIRDIAALFDSVYVSFYKGTPSIDHFNWLHYTIIPLCLPC